MKAVVVGMILVLTVGAMAADQVVNIKVTIPDAQVAEMVEVIATETPLYDVTQVVTTNTWGPISNKTTRVSTNHVRSVVAETPKQKFKRLSANLIVRYWARKLRAFKKNAVVVETPVTTD